MSNQKGFTLIELMVVIVIGLIGLTMIANAVGFASGNSSISFGVNGMTESRCIDGYKFIVSQDGNARQILDEFGKGARCEKQSKPEGF
jgi:prepilin-type N-terminal cleavage/methylation domain-containing protein